MSVSALRWQGVLITFALDGLAGAYLSVDVVNNWREGQTLGLGFISLAALILSNWDPRRLMVVAFLFGFAWWAPVLLAGAWLSTHWLLRESAVWFDRNTDEVRRAQRDWPAPQRQ